MQDGYKVEAVVKQLIRDWPDNQLCQFQVEFKTSDGLLARTDMFKRIEDDTIDLYEIKASTSLKSSTGQDHVEDAAFQTLVAERAGQPVRNIYIIHVDKNYVRQGVIDPLALLTIVDVTQEVRDCIENVADTVAKALSLLQQDSIDEDGCTCLLIGNQNNHCAAFDYLNPNVPEQSVYWLPRISKSKLETFVAEGRLALTDVEESDLTASQIPVLRAAKTGAPVINLESIKAFLDDLTYPLHFYDYETFASAIPIADGIRPQQAIPVQFSLHRLEKDGNLTHYEFLSDRPGQQVELLQALKSASHETGTFVSWNMHFEKGCNDRMAEAHPEFKDFLDDVNARTVDLMVPFKKDYVDVGFRGSTSIKKVLPVLVPDLEYDMDAVHDGGGAMAAWMAYFEPDNICEQERLQRELLNYCELDTLAMVEIFKVLKRVTLRDHRCP